MQENIDAIVSISQQYKDCESLSEISHPFDINFGESTTIQDKYDKLMTLLCPSSSEMPMKPLRTDKLSQNLNPKLIKMGTENLNESEPGSLDIKLPDTSSLEISIVSNTDVLSTAKMIYKLKNDTAVDKLNGETTLKGAFDV